MLTDNTDKNNDFFKNQNHNYYINKGNFGDFFFFGGGTLCFCFHIRSSKIFFINFLFLLSMILERKKKLVIL